MEPPWRLRRAPTSYLALGGGAGSRAQVWGRAQREAVATALVWSLRRVRARKIRQKKPAGAAKALCALSWNRSRRGGCARAPTSYLALGGGAGSRAQVWGRAQREAVATALVWSLRRVRARKIRQKKPASAAKALCALSWNWSRSVAAAPGAATSLFKALGGGAGAAPSYGVFAKARRSPSPWYGSSACARSKNQAEKTS